MKFRSKNSMKLLTCAKGLISQKTQGCSKGWALMDRQGGQGGGKGREAQGDAGRAGNAFVDLGSCFYCSGKVESPEVRKSESQNLDDNIRILH
jgi:hypothetical protein